MAETFTKDQSIAVSKLRSLLKGEIPSSMYEDTRCLLRFLKARDYNVKKAESMIRKNVRWLKEMQMENFLTDFKTPEVLLKYFPISFLGCDKEGVPIEYIEYEKLDDDGLYKFVNVFQIRKFFIKVFEKDIEYFKKSGKGNSPQLLLILNVSQINFSRFLNNNNYRVFLKIAMEFQDNYPEHAKNIIVINASPAFAAIWQVMREWLGSNLLKKVFIYGRDGWKEELLKRIDADVLPAFLGGTRTDPDGNPLCLTTVNRGGIIPKEYLTEIDTPNFLKNPETTTIRIGRQKQHSVQFQVTEPNSIINWEFFVKSHDIGFGLLRLTSDETMEEVIPVHKVETEVLTEQGIYRCKSPGNYFFIFDNSYSWINSKEICYRIWTTPYN